MSYHPPSEGKRKGAVTGLERRWLGGKYFVTGSVVLSGGWPTRETWQEGSRADQVPALLSLLSSSDLLPMISWMNPTLSYWVRTLMHVYQSKPMSLGRARVEKVGA